jgi:hypothetical protein
MVTTSVAMLLLNVYVTPLVTFTVEYSLAYPHVVIDWNAPVHAGVKAEEGH